MSKLNIGDAYRQFVDSLKGSHEQGSREHEKAMQTAIGGEFDAVGVIERELLIKYGLGRNDYLVDVGCGSGRLAKPLSQYLRGRYLGTDVVPELVRHAQSIVGRPDWRFEAINGLAIPEKDGQADMVCFFSVITHLLHEQSYVYLQDAKRVLKSGGRIVVSFLEFAIPSHWNVFEGTLANLGSQHLNMFVGRDGLQAWAAHLGLEVVAFLDGDKAQTALPHPITFEDGRVVSGEASLGQSVCVLRKP